MASGFTENDSAMYGSDKAAWHGHGTVVSGTPDAETAYHASGINWQVLKRPAECGGLEVPGFFVTFRDDLPETEAARFLGVVQSRYHIIQNREVLDIADGLIGEGGAKFETLGSLWGGKRCYATIVLPGILKVKDDDVAKYLVIRWSHDGTTSIEGGITPVRVVCWNTLRAAFKAARDTVCIKHSANAYDKIEEARRILKLTDTYYNRVGEVFNRMADVTVNDRFVDAYLKAIIPGPESGNDKRAAGIRDNIRGLFNGGQRGGDMDAVKGTAWGLFNATTEYVDHARGTKAQNGRGATEARMDSILWGSGAKLRQDSFDVLTKQLGILEADGAPTPATVLASN